MPKPFSLTTPLPADALWFESMHHTAGLSVLEETQYQLLSTHADLEPEKLLGQPVDLQVALRDGQTRHLCGHITRFGIGQHQGRHFGYQATVRPWLWFLTRTSDCRIFQEMTVPDIVEAVFKDHAAVAHYQLSLARSYRKRVYCVQYRETDFNFIARLLEDEGIYWYFAHSEGQHTLMLVDAPSAHTPMAGNPQLPFYDNDGQVPPDTEFVSHWQFARSVKPGKTVLTSYDFERPSTNLKVQQTLGRSYNLADEELFDYQGDYVQKGDGQQQADDRLDEQQCRFERQGGRSNAHALATGHCFTLARHPRDDQNANYLCLQLDLSVRNQSGESGSSAGDLHCSFAAQDASQTFRPQRRTPRPFVQGLQTAVVVGPAGEELFTDKYGRVKVQFHWDRYGQKNEKSSCWVRVSTPWAGKSFGFIHVPRIGQEVVVDFLEGDPDQPLITGRVYNAEQMPPWALPANATQSGVLSRSSKGGAYGNANALRFEDKKGAEQLWLHAEKDQLTEVENDEDKWVGRDRRKTIDQDETNHIKRDRTETVDRNEKITVHGWRTEEVDLDEKVTIHKNRTERVDLDEKISIGMNRSEDVGVNESISIGSNRSVSIGGSKTETVAMAKAETIGLAKALSIGAAYQTTVGGLMNTTVGLTQATQVGLSKSAKVGKSYSITAGDELSITVGKSSLVMKKDGTIAITGKDLFINGKNIDVVGDTHIGMESKRIDLN